MICLPLKHLWEAELPTLSSSIPAQRSLISLACEALWRGRSNPRLASYLRPCSIINRFVFPPLYPISDV